MHGRSVLVPINLWVALQTLRKAETERLFWIDYLCIHRTFSSEVAAEIVNMNGHFAKARRVLVYSRNDVPLPLQLFTEDFTDTRRVEKKVEAKSRVIGNPFGALQSHLADTLLQPHWLISSTLHGIACAQEVFLQFDATCISSRVVADYLDSSARCLVLSTDVLSLMPGFRGDAGANLKYQFWEILQRFRYLLRNKPIQKADFRLLSKSDYARVIIKVMFL